MALKLFRVFIALAYLLCSVLTMAQSDNTVHPFANQPPKDPTRCKQVKSYDKKKKRYTVKEVCTPPVSFETQVDTFIQSLSYTEQTALEKRLQAQLEIQESHYGISFYEPTYILPFYYTGNAYQSVYVGHYGGNDSLSNAEFKGVLSIQLPIWERLLDSNLSVNVSYTQLSYWQFYAASQFFRETDYEPQIFFSDYISPNFLLSLGVNHQSNGYGFAALERSWNRLYMEFSFSGHNWLINVKPWILIFKKDSSDVYNPDIADYLGNGRVVFAIKFHKQELSLMVRNAIESGFKRGALELDYSFPLNRFLQAYFQFFTGYGQSLIEYNHYTNSFGVGIALSNWI